MKDKLTQQNLVILSLSFITVLTIIGYVALSLFDKENLDVLTNLAFSAVGALGAILTGRNPDSERAAVSPIQETQAESIVHDIGNAAVKAILNEARKNMEDK